MTHNDTFSSIWSLQDKSNSCADIRLQQAYFVKGTCQAAHAGGKVGVTENVSINNNERKKKSRVNIAIKRINHVN